MRNLIAAGMAVLTIALVGACSKALMEQNLVRVDEGAKESLTFFGRVWSIPEERAVSKIVIVGQGRARNLEIYAKSGGPLWQTGLQKKAGIGEVEVYAGYQQAQWKPVKKIKEMVVLPIEIEVHMKTDAIRILQNTVTGHATIDAIQFYGPAPTAK